MAALLGLPHWSAGQHVVRNDRGWRDDEIRTCYIWSAAIMPSFHQSVLIGLAAFDESEFRGIKHEACLRAGVLTMEKPTCSALADPADWLGLSVTAVVEVDAVAVALGAVGLVSKEDHSWLDGIGYRMHIQCADLESHLRFSNPTHDSWRAVEMALFGLAGEVGRQSGDRQLGTYLEQWREYMNRQS